MFKRLFQLWCRAMRLACIIVGPCFLLLGLGWAIHTKFFIQHARRTDGSIIRMEPGRDNDGVQVYTPVFQFRSDDGLLHIVTSEVSSSPPAFNVGDKVSALYKAANPNDAEINTPMQLWFLPILFGAIGVSALMIGAVLEKRHRKKQRFQTIPASETYPRIA